MLSNRFFGLNLVSVALCAGPLCAAEQLLPQVRIAKDGRTFETEADKPFVPAKGLLGRQTPL
jgi:hypothetical protein